jgi:hypothetical protein
MSERYYTMAGLLYQILNTVHLQHVMKSPELMRRVGFLYGTGDNFSSENNQDPMECLQVILGKVSLARGCMA